VQAGNYPLATPALRLSVSAFFPSRLLGNREFAPAKKPARKPQEETGKGVTLYVQDNHRPPGNTTHLSQESAHLNVGKVVKERGGHCKIEAAPGERQRERVGRDSGRTSGFQVERPLV
jgi:hypothetical protein